MYERRPWERHEMIRSRDRLHYETNERIQEASEEVPLSWFIEYDGDSWFGETTRFTEFLEFWFNVTEMVIDNYEWQGLHVTVSQMQQIVDEDRKMFLK